jgi:magnesium chelatase family protein
VAKLNTFSLLGMDALPVEVDVDILPSGLSKTVLFAMNNQACRAVGNYRYTSLVGAGNPLTHYCGPKCRQSTIRLP